MQSSLLHCTTMLTKFATVSNFSFTAENPSIINVITLDSHLTVNEFSIIQAHVEANQCMRVLQCDITCPLPCPLVAPQKGVADLCLHQLQCTCKCMFIPVLKFAG